jgi:hypothetical protein
MASAAMIDRTLFSSIFDHRSVFCDTVRADLHFSGDGLADLSRSQKQISCRA